MNYKYKYVEDYIVLYTNKFETKIDKEDLNLVLSNVVRLSIRKNNKSKIPYVMYHPEDNNERYSFARLIMDAPEDMEVDHIYHDTFDNRKSKLRILTPTENKNNKRISTRSHFGFPGIYWRNERWLAKNKMNGKFKHIGVFDDLREAVFMMIVFKKTNMPQIYLAPDRYGETIEEKLTNCDCDNLITPRLMIVASKYWVRCPNCEQVGKLGDTKQEAIDSWNNKSHLKFDLYNTRQYHTK
jgi:hypothetical protein